MKNIKVPAGTSLFIATPCYGAMLHSSYVTSLLCTCEYLPRGGVRVRPQFAPGDSLVQRARNVLVAQFMASDFTHLMFIDGDIAWQPEAVGRLLAATQCAGVDVAGGIYSRKTVPASWPVNFLTGEPGRHPETGYVEIKDAPTGFLMIRRTAIEKMMAAYPERQCRMRENPPPAEAKYEFALFDCFPDEGWYLSEDYGFSRLWQRTGGRVWMDPEINLAHYGQYRYAGEVASIFEGL